MTALKKKYATIFSTESAAQMTPGETRIFHDVTDLSIIQDDNYRQLDEKRITLLRGSIEATGVATEVELEVKLDDSGRLLGVRCVDGHHRKEVVSRMRKEAEEENQPWLSRPLPVKVRCVTGSKDEASGKTSRQAAVRSVISNTIHVRDGLVGRARAVGRLSDSGLPNTKIAETLGLDPRTVERLLLVLSLPEKTQTLLEENDGYVKESRVYEIARRAKNSQNRTTTELFAKDLDTLLALGPLPESQLEAAHLLLTHEIGEARLGRGSKKTAPKKTATERDETVSADTKSKVSTHCANATENLNAVTRKSSAGKQTTIKAPNSKVASGEKPGKKPSKTEGMITISEVRLILEGLRGEGLSEEWAGRIESELRSLGSA